MPAGWSAAKPGPMARTAVHCDGNGETSQRQAEPIAAHFALWRNSLERSFMLPRPGPALRCRRRYDKTE